MPAKFSSVSAHASLRRSGLSLWLQESIRKRYVCVLHFGQLFERGGGKATESGEAWQETNVKK